jgi:hypothetical protein
MNSIVIVLAGSTVASGVVVGVVLGVVLQPVSDKLSSITRAITLDKILFFILLPLYFLFSDYMYCPIVGLSGITDELVVISDIRKRFRSL